LQVLSPDKELKEDLVKRTMSVEGKNLKVDFLCISARMTRIAVNGFLESLDLVVTSMGELGDIYNESIEAFGSRTDLSNASG
jgi:EKC/KEOPS complex subunit PCC1/LAGE3